MELLGLVPAAGILAILFALYLARDVLSRHKGTKEMQEVAAAIYEGAMAFLNRQYRTIGICRVVGLDRYRNPARRDSTAGQRRARLCGRRWRSWSARPARPSPASSACGSRSRRTCVPPLPRTVSLKDALQVSLRGGAVSGLLVVSLSLLGVLGIFAAYGGLARTRRIAPYLIVGFGFGASFVALFAQLGGGIYTKAADVGSDLVGKVEAGIPEDDPRNAAVVADLVGDNVGDCAGRGADLFESTAAENIGAMILGIAIYLAPRPRSRPGSSSRWSCARSASSPRSSACTWWSRPGRSHRRPGVAGPWLLDDDDPRCAIGIVAVTMFDAQNSWWLVCAGLIGLATSVIFVYLTQYYTAGSWRPVQEIARASRTGPATNIISGFAVGLETTAITAIVISIALAVATTAARWAASYAGLYLADESAACSGPPSRRWAC